MNKLEEWIVVGTQIDQSTSLKEDARKNSHFQRVECTEWSRWK